MKNISFRLLSFMILSVFYFTATAQHTDSIYKSKKIKDSIFRLAHPGHFVPDTFHQKRNIARKTKHDSLSRKKVALFMAQKKSSDSTYKKMNIERKKNYTYHKDSVYKKFIAKKKSTDSVRKKYYLQNAKYNSLKKQHTLNIKLDSFHRSKLFKSVKLDSVKRKVYLQNIKSDSQRIKKYLQLKKIQLQQFQADTATTKNGYRSRELSMEITCNDGDTVYISNSYKKVIIKIMPSQKLRLSTIINYRQALNYRDNEIFKKMGIVLWRNQNSVKAIVNGIKPPGYRDTNEACEDELQLESNVKRPLFIELPGNTVIVLHTKYAETDIENFVPDINAQITNGSLRMSNAGKAIIKSTYSTIKADDIKKAELDLSTTRFTASNITAMTIVSNSSTMQLSNCSTMNVASVSDEYTVAKAGSISGNKDFGKLNIENLKEQLILTGASADIKINNFSYEAPLIKIDSKYADLKLPLYNQKNYAVYYEGSYNDVNKLSTSTQKISGTGNITARLSVAKDTLASIDKPTNVNKTRFEAIAGDITGRHTKIDIVCPFCNVVFN